MKRYRAMPLWRHMIGIIGAVWLATAVPSAVWAQSAATAEWSDPRNLSLSGGSSAAQIVVDANGIAHTLWRARNGALLYARAAGDAWSAPTAVETPFATERFNQSANQPAQVYTPQLIASRDGALHAVWIAADGALFYSAVAPNGFASFSNWSPRVLLGSGAVAFHAAAGQDGRLHVAYARAAEPAGLYYAGAALAPGVVGQTWSEARRLDDSGYFRSVDAATAHLRVAAGERSVYVAYDVRAEERIWLAYSGSGGAAFAAPRLIAERQAADRADAVGPRELRVVAEGRRALLVWQAGDAGEACRVRALWSADDGAAWGEASPAVGPTTTCPTPTERTANPPAHYAATPYLPADDAAYLVLASPAGTQRQTQLLVWDGARWSNPQPLPQQFTNPVTYRPLAWGCHTPVWQPPDRLLLLLCDVDGAGDIWVSSRALTDPDAAWFPTPTPPPPWQATAEDAALPAAPQRMQLLAARDGRVLAFLGNRDGAAIELAVWDGARLSRPTAVLTSPGGRVGDFAAVAVRDDQVAVAWEDVTDGRLYVSRSVTARAAGAGDWSPAVAVPAPRAAAGAPTMVVDRAGTLWLAYAVRLNEQRGLYVTSSADLGATWTDPTFVFDGAAAGWERVDAPHLAVGTSGDLHLLWSRGVAADGLPARELRYSRSGDGATWSGALRVADGAIGWSDLLAVGERAVHRFWVTAQGNRPQLLHAVSLDGGLNWEGATTIVGDARPLGATADAAGRVHLVTAENGALTRRVWQDGRWTVGETQAAELSVSPVGLAGTGDAIWLAAAVTVPESAATPAPAAGLRLWRLGLTLLDQLPTPLPTLTPTLMPTVPTSTPAPLPTPTPTFSVAPPTPGLALPGLPQNSPVGLIALAAVPAVLIVALTVVVGIRRRNNR